MTYGPAHNSLGMLYFQQHQLYLAAWEFEYAARVMPGRAEPLYNLGLVLESAGKLDEAVEAYLSAYALDAQNPHIIGNMARVRLRQGADLEQVRPFLEDLVFYDNRPEWVVWAEEQLGLHPNGSVQAQSELPIPAPEELHRRIPDQNELPVPIDVPPIMFGQ